MLRADAVRRERWDHTAELLSLTAECHRDPRRRRREFTAAEFHPYRQGEAGPHTEGIVVDCDTLPLVAEMIVGTPPPWSPKRV